MQHKSVNKFSALKHIKQTNNKILHSLVPNEMQLPLYYICSHFVDEAVRGAVVLSRSVLGKSGR